MALRVLAVAADDTLTSMVRRALTDSRTRDIAVRAVSPMLDSRVATVYDYFVRVDYLPFSHEANEPAHKDRDVSIKRRRFVQAQVIISAGRPGQCLLV
jgi:hypothetical protein